MKMEPTVSSETSAIRTQTRGNYPKRNTLHLEHGESLKTGVICFVCPLPQAGTREAANVFRFQTPELIKISYNAIYKFQEKYYL